MLRQSWLLSRRLSSTSGDGWYSSQAFACARILCSSRMPLNAYMTNVTVPCFRLLNLNVRFHVNLALKSPYVFLRRAEEHADTLCISRTFSCLHSEWLIAVTYTFKMQRQLNKSFYVHSFSYESIDVKVSLKPYLSCIKSTVIVKIFHSICDPNVVACLILFSHC